MQGLRIGTAVAFRYISPIPLVFRTALKGQHHRHVLELRLEGGRLPDLGGLGGNGVAADVVQGAAVVEVGVACLARTIWPGDTILVQLIDHIFGDSAVFVQLSENLGVSAALHVLPDYIDIAVALGVVLGEGVNHYSLVLGILPSVNLTVSISHRGGGVEVLPCPVAPELELHCGAAPLVIVPPDLLGRIVDGPGEGQVDRAAVIGPVGGRPVVGGVGVVVGDQKIVVFFQATCIQLIPAFYLSVRRRHFVGDGGAVQVVPPGVADDEPGPGGVLFLGSVLAPGRPVPSRFIPILELEVDFPIFHQIAQLAGHLIVVVSPIAGTEPKGSQDGVGDAVQLLEGAPAQAKLKGDRVLQDIIPATSAIYRGVFPQVLLRDLRQHIVTHRGRRDGPGDGQGGFHRLQGRVPVLIFFPARLLCDDISLFIHLVGEAGESALPIVHRPDARAGLRDHGGGPRAQAQTVQ